MKHIYLHYHAEISPMNYWEKCHVSHTHWPLLLHELSVLSVQEKTNISYTVEIHNSMPLKFVSRKKLGHNINLHTYKTRKYWQSLIATNMNIYIYINKPHFFTWHSIRVPPDCTKSSTITTWRPLGSPSFIRTILWSPSLTLLHTTYKKEIDENNLLREKGFFL